MWAPLIGELAGLSIYAVDSIGESGLSVQTAAMPSRDSVVAWLESVLDVLALDRTHLCSESYGGWIAINAAMRRPQRVATLTLLEPVLDPLRRYLDARTHGRGIARTTETATKAGAPSTAHGRRSRSGPRAAMPNLEGELIADAGHSLPLDHAAALAP